ncbi:NUMOD4 domain-containing protein [Rossellomorea sp. FS2]
MNWRPLNNIVKCGEFYEVSDCGNVRNLKTQKVLKPSQKKNGYLHVRLYNKGGSYDYLVHRLVALAFLPTSGTLQVNHKDGNKSNNCMKNLEWVTPLENAKHATELGLRISKEEHAALMVRLHAKPVVKISEEGSLSCTYESTADAARKNGVTRHAVSRQFRFEYKSRLNDFYFRYAEKEAK